MTLSTGWNQASRSHYGRRSGVDPQVCRSRGVSGPAQSLDISHLAERFLFPHQPREMLLLRLLENEPSIHDSGNAVIMPYGSLRRKQLFLFPHSEARPFA